VLFAGLTSSSREAIRPIVRQKKVPYFYSSLYEGGACDKQTFVTGATASQQLSVLIEWAIKECGPKIYVMAPDYNFGTISAHWVEFYAKQFGGEVLGADFLPLTVSDYAPTIQKIQAAKPDFVVALPVGANQTGFLEQFAAAGLKEKIGIVSTNYGSGNQQVVVSPDAGDGIIASQEYFMWVEGAANDAFKKKWETAYGLSEPIVSEAADVWNAVHLWAAAAQKAGSTENDAVIAALESGLSFEGPNGTVTMLGASHHLKQNIYIARGNKTHGFDIIKTYEGAGPAFEDEKCDLIKNPETAEHFTPAGL
jgi:urea transport system substrate-binding protein